MPYDLRRTGRSSTRGSVSRAAASRDRSLSRAGMSRKPPKNDDTEDAICPVCKTSRYLNPNMRFKINPECYHKMCESCVDRIFSHGPTLCPIAGCSKTLRKQRFRYPTFDDLRVEREVDIRKRVTSIFNRRESEFTTLLAYNNYLEEVESLTFNLITKTDVAATEAKLKAYQQANTASIIQNAALASQENSSQAQRAAAEREALHRSRQAAKMEEEAEREEREEERRNVLEQLKQGGDAEAIVKEGQKVMLKKSSARRKEADAKRSAAAQEQVQQQILGQRPGAISVSAADDGVFRIAGLKPVERAVASPPYSPFAGIHIAPKYFDLQEKYENPFLDAAKTNARMLAGGYDVGEYRARAMMDAFAGLGVFVAEEVAARERENA